MKRMLRGLVGISALLIAAPLSTAFAADMPIKSAPPPVPVIVSDWTGFYFDVDVGWQRDTYNWSYNSPLAVGVVTGPFSMNNSDGSVGAHVGYQQQFGWLVAGVEAGASKSWNGNFATQISSVPAPGVCPTAPVGSFCRASLTSVSTFGGKLGVDWSDWLVYGVGGAAFGATLKSDNFNVGPIGTFSFGAPQNDHGWYAGGGVDFMALKTRLVDVIVGAEYEHVQLKTIQVFSSLDGFLPGINERAISAKEDIVWAKLTVKWNPFNP